VIYHEHDSPPDHWQGATSVIMWPRRWLFRRVFCIWPNLRRAELAAPECKRRAIVWNCPRREEAQPQREPAVPGELHVFYHGSVSPTRLPLAVIQAVALLPAGVRLTAVIYETIGSARHSQQLREEAERLGVADRVAILKQRPRFESMQLCAEMDVGLTFMPLRTDDSNEEHASTASNKAFDYLACGVALLMSDRPDWRTTFADAGMGQVCNPEDPASIAAALRWFLEHPTEMRAMGERGRRRVLDDWNYEAQFQPVLDWMNKHG
jgi:glycosyltransferase involved in cell wall biosynthesis